MKVIHFPLTGCLISLTQVQNSFSSLQMKKSPIFATDVSSATAISFAYQWLLIAIMLISMYVPTIILGGKIGANLPKWQLQWDV